MKSFSPPPSPLRGDTSPPEGVEDRPTPILAHILHPAKRGGGAEHSEAEGGKPAIPSRSRRKPGTTERARQLRWVENDAEGLLWLELKGRRLGGYHFVRQYPIGPYFADFCCRKQKLVIELDGFQHTNRDSYDRARDAFMRSEGYSILRFWSHEVAKQRRAICETILAVLESRLVEDVIAPDLRFVFAQSQHE